MTSWSILLQQLSIKPAAGSKECIYCTKFFIPPLMVPYKKYCSMECQQKAATERKRERRCERNQIVEL